MCGILGTVPAARVDVFSDALSKISHRGPDSHGIWNGDGDVLLGHRRLSIMDLSPNGRQPMLNSSERFAIVFNGEIYNFLEIKHDLEKQGYQFLGDSDTEVVLAAYLEWGDVCQHKFNGMWAFAIWDRFEKTLFLSRDRFGKKPLFYSRLSDDTFVFASEMKAIYPFLNEVRPSNEIKEQLSFIFDYEYTGDCVVSGIRRLPAGHSATFVQGVLKVRRWWNTLDFIEEPPRAYEDQVERWRELFLDSVRLRMRSDVPIGTALSGGLDSSATFCAMSYVAANSQDWPRRSNDWGHGFCSHYPGSSLDELKWAKKVTDFLNLPLESVEIDPLRSGWSVNDALYQVEDPYITLPLPMLATYKAIANAGIKVTLDGHGADELFCGYGHISSAFISANPSQLAELLAIQESLTDGNYSIDHSFNKFRWLKSQIIERLNSSNRIPKNIAKAALGRLDWSAINHKLRFEDQAHPNYKRLDPLSQKLYELFHITILPTLLRNYDRYSMASGVEIRMPFMDWRLVCFTFSLPWTSKVGGGFTKRIMRDALKGIMPEEVRTRRDKIGWNAPLHEWFKGPLKDEIYTAIKQNNFDKKALFEWRKFQANPSPSFDDGQKLWSKILPEIWRSSLKKN